jgi:hypothetical protein
MSSFWIRPAIPATWHVVCSWPDGRTQIVAVRRSQREAAQRMQRSVARLLDLNRQSDLGPRATG